MKNLKVIHDKEGNTLTIWFGEPSLEYVCEETGNETILIRDREGNLIGIEKLNFSKQSEPVSFTFERLPS